jgi:hypothetical protein
VKISASTALAQQVTFSKAAKRLLRLALDSDNPDAAIAARRSTEHLIAKLATLPTEHFFSLCVPTAARYPAPLEAADVISGARLLHCSSGQVKPIMRETGLVCAADRGGHDNTTGVWRARRGRLGARSPGRAEGSQRSGGPRWPVAALFLISVAILASTSYCPVTSSSRETGGSALYSGKRHGNKGHGDRSTQNTVRKFGNLGRGAPP